MLLSFLLSFFMPVLSYGQKVFEFNRPKSRCYFKYINYAPNNDLRNRKRPYIFVLAKEGSSAQEAFDADSIKNLPQFHKYKFVYVPNKGGSVAARLYCFYAFVRHSTYNFTCGKSNVFLYSYDTSIKDYSYLTSGLFKVFNTVQVVEPVGENKANDYGKELAKTFKENPSEYKLKKISEEDEYGTFYTEENEFLEEDAASSIPLKSYFGPPSAFAYTLSGIVKDKSSGEALPFAAIIVKGSNIGVSSNVDGYFTIPSVPTDTSVLSVSYVGYAPRNIYLSPYLPHNDFVIELSPVSNSLSGVTIIGKKEDAVLSKKEEVGVMKLTPRQLEKFPSFGEKDVMRSFQLMPGVSASQESSSGLYVRGGTPDQNLILYDGFTVYHVDHLFGFFSAFNSNALKDVQLYKGGFESRFGGRLSSVTELTGKDGNQKRFRIGGEISLLSLNAFAELPVGNKFTSVIAYRRSYKGLIYNALFDKFITSEGTKITQPEGGGPNRFTQESEATNYFYDLNTKLTYRPNKRDIFSLSVFNGTDKLDNSSSFSMPSMGGESTDISNNSTDLTKYGNIGSSFKWSRKWTDKFYGNTNVSYSNYYSKRDMSRERISIDDDGEELSSNTGIFEDNDLRDYSLKSDYQWNISLYNQLQFGAFGTDYDIEYSYAQSDTLTILDKKNQSVLAGGYLQCKFKFVNSKLVLLPGIRGSFYEMTEKAYLEPRVSLSYSLTDEWTLKTATGRYYQFANQVTREDIMSGSKDFWLLADGEQIPVSSSDHFIAGVSFENIDYLFSIEGYYKNVYDLTEYSLRFNPSPDGVVYEESFYSGKGYATGVEFLAQKLGGDITGWVSYTLGEAKSRFDVYSDSYFYANQDVRHEFKVVAMYDYKRWNFSATWVYATGRPYTAPGGAYTVELLDGTTEDFYTVTTKNGLRLPDYHRADVSAKYKLLGGRKGDLKRREIGHVGLSIFNLYNRTNVWYKTFSIEDGAVIETNVNYTGFTPNLSVSLKLW